MKSGISITLSPKALSILDRLATFTGSNRSATLERLLREMPTPTDAILERTHCKVLAGIPTNNLAANSYVSSMAGISGTDILPVDYENIQAGLHGIFLAALAVENAIIRRQKCESESMLQAQSTE